MELSRDHALKIITLSIQLYNQSTKEEDKQKAYEALVKGIKELIQVAKNETNPQIKQTLQQKINEFLSQAEQIKPKNIQKQEQTQNKKVNKEKEQQDKENQKLKDGLEAAIVKETPNIKWTDVAGLENAKKSLQEAVVLPINFPQMFEGMRKPWKGILLYGPPGTGKSLLAKACATECKATFFSISSSDLISKYVGESEKLVRALFEMARANKPSIIFIDEIDSLTGSRSEGENEASRRVKTEFLVQMDGVGKDDKGVLVLGATNIPWGLDSAIRRRFEKRVYIALPCKMARAMIIQNSLESTPNDLVRSDIENVAEQTEGFSGSDMAILIKNACYMPLRNYQNAEYFVKVENKYHPCDQYTEGVVKMNFMDLDQNQINIPPVSKDDFLQALQKTKPSVCKKDIDDHVNFTKEFGQDG